MNLSKLTAKKLDLFRDINDAIRVNWVKDNARCTFTLRTEIESLKDLEKIKEKAKLKFIKYIFKDFTDIILDLDLLLCEIESAKSPSNPLTIEEVFNKNFESLKVFYSMVKSLKELFNVEDE